MFGHDISWPQCPSSAGGFALPLPPESTAFVIVGLTRGLAFTENPCLQTQVNWVKTRAKPAHAYAMATFPTAAQLTTYGSAGPWPTATRADRLRNVGFAEGRAALASLGRVEWSPPVVWVDVEPRPAQPWPSSTDAQRLENRYVLTGLMRALREGGVGFGFYSYTSGWQSITGSWRLPGVPVWATAGRLDYPEEALDRCTQPSFSGGPVLISQWYDDTRDYDRTCGAYHFTPFGASTFVDVTPWAQFFDEIEWLWSEGITRGSPKPEGTVEFHPTSVATREAMAAFLYRFAGSPAFTPPASSPFIDVPPTHPFYKEISWLAARGISKGSPVAGGRYEFRPSLATSRMAMAAFIYRFEGSPPFTPPTTSPFVDVPLTHLFYREISWLAATGISRGSPIGGGRVEFRPDLATSREAMAAFLYRTNELR